MHLKRWSPWIVVEETIKLPIARKFRYFFKTFMIDSLWISGIYFFAALVGTLTKFTKNSYATIYTGYFGSICFIFGGLHEMFFGELIVVQLLGLFCFLAGIYLGGLWEGLEKEERRFNQEIKDLQDKYRNDIKKRLWNRRN